MKTGVRQSAKRSAKRVRARSEPRLQQSASIRGSDSVSCLVVDLVDPKQGSGSEVSPRIPSINQDVAP